MDLVMFVTGLHWACTDIFFLWLSVLFFCWWMSTSVASTPYNRNILQTLYLDPCNASLVMWHTVSIILKPNGFGVPNHMVLFGISLWNSNTHLMSYDKTSIEHFDPWKALSWPLWNDTHFSPLNHEMSVYGQQITVMNPRNKTFCFKNLSWSLVL